MPSAWLWTTYRPTARPATCARNLPTDHGRHCANPRRGLEVHINTLVTHESMVDVPALRFYQGHAHRPVERLLPGSGKGTKSLSELTLIQAEVLMNWIYDVCARRTFPSTSWRRPSTDASSSRGCVRPAYRSPRSPRRRKPPSSVWREGNGIVFRLARGDVYRRRFSRSPVVAGVAHRTLPPVQAVQGAAGSHASKGNCADASTGAFAAAPAPVRTSPSTTGAFPIPSALMNPSECSKPFEREAVRV